MVSLMRVKRVVCEGVPSLSWSEQFEGPFFWSDQDSVSLQADAAIALCDDDATRRIKNIFVRREVSREDVSSSQLVRGETFGV
jgi:hypothetical protein